MRTNVLDWLSIVLVVIGAINWGLIGLFELNLVVTILTPIFESAALDIVVRAIYVLVGLAGVYFLYPAYKLARSRRREAEATTL